MAMRARAFGALLLVASLAWSAPSAGAAPDTLTRDADLFCPGSRTLTTSEWVWAVPGSLWIKAGPLAGHYAVLHATQNELAGLVYAPPASLPPAPVSDEAHGGKGGLADGAMTCTFLSRWAVPNLTVLGILTVAPHGH